MRKREKNYENVKKRHLLRKFYFQNPCIESYILMHFPNLEMSFFDMKFFEIWQRMTRFSNGLNFKTIFQYSNDLILVSNRKEVTKSIFSISLVPFMFLYGLLQRRITITITISPEINGNPYTQFLDLSSSEGLVSYKPV